MERNRGRQPFTFFQMAADISDVAAAQAQLLGRDIGDRFCFYFCCAAVYTSATGPPVVGVPAKVSEKDVGQFMTKHPIPAGLIQALVKRNTHLPPLISARNGGEACICRGEQLDVDADRIVLEGVSTGSR